MTYTVSHRQAGVQRSAVGGLIRHEFRNIDKGNGVETQHSNERIIPARTLMNESVMFVDGQPVEVTDTRQITDELDRRLSKAGGTRTNKKTGQVTNIAVRKDAKVVRDIVLQLDPNFTRSSELLTGDGGSVHREEVRRLLGEMVDHYGDVYGRHNLLAASTHWDETSPHIHLMVTPIDEQGRVRQESFIPAGRGSSSGLSKNDRAMRERLKGAGYDVDPRPRGGNRSNMSIEEYSQWQERVEDLEAREVEVEDRERAVERRALTYKANREFLQGREASVSAQETEVGKKAAEAEKIRQEGVRKLQEAQEVRRRANAAGRAAQAAKKKYEEELEAAREEVKAVREQAQAAQEAKRVYAEGTRRVQEALDATKEVYEVLDKLRPSKPTGTAAKAKERNARLNHLHEFQTSSEKAKADDWEYGG